MKAKPKPPTEREVREDQPKAKKIKKVFGMDETGRVHTVTWYCFCYLLNLFSMMCVVVFVFLNPSIHPLNALNHPSIHPLLSSIHPATHCSHPSIQPPIALTQVEIEVSGSETDPDEVRANKSSSSSSSKSKPPPVKAKPKNKDDKEKKNDDDKEKKSDDDEIAPGASWMSISLVGLCVDVFTIDVLVIVFTNVSVIGKHNLSWLQHFPFQLLEFKKQIQMKTLPSMQQE